MEEEALAFCPSFTYYSSHQSAKVVPTAQVTPERNPLETSTDSEFTFVRSVYDVAADEIFGEDQIFPIFDRDLLTRNDLDRSDDKRPTELILRLTLEKSFVDNVIGEERNPTSSLSSSELDADEVDSLPEEMYCIWRPKVVEKSPGRWKKSNSTGTSSSKQWKIRDFLHRRSNSEGTREDSFVFLTPENGDLRKAEKQGIRVETTTTGKAKAKKVSSMSAHEVFYVRNRAWKEGERRKSYLPYRQDLVGLFANVNAYGKTSPPFWTCFR